MRISRDEMFMRMAFAAAKRSTCNRKKVGAILVFENRPISIGYAGSAPGEPHCIDVGCKLGPDGGCIRTIHAENNAIVWANNQGTLRDGCTLYTTCSPCLDCAEYIAERGIIRVVYSEVYRKIEGLEYLSDSGIQLQNHAKKPKL